MGTPKKGTTLTSSTRPSLRALLATLTIVDKEGLSDFIRLAPPRTGPLTSGDFAWAQRPFVRKFQQQRDQQEPVRIIVLKARQLGITTVTAGLNFLERHTYEGTNGLTIAHDSETTASIYDKTRLFRDAWSFSELYPQKSATQRWMVWAMNSSMRIATAKSIRSGRGRTVHFLHASEVAFWDDPETLMTGLRPSLPHKPGTAIVLESTANGVGNYFHHIWVDAVAGRNEFSPMFFPWWKHYEYTMPVTTLNDEKPDDYERFLLREGATREHLEWRRWAIPNIANHDENYFMQEYPATPQEAFISSGTNVFPRNKLEACYHRKSGAHGDVHQITDGRFEFVPDPLGQTRIFAWPARDRDWGQYVVAADPSRTTMGDDACIQVIHKGTFEQMAVWHGKCNPIEFASHVARLGYYYHTAMVAPEIEGPGHATIGALVTMGYPNIFRHHRADTAQGKVSQALGWSTSFNRKHWAIGNLIGLLGRGKVEIHDKQTFEEMADYVALGNGEMGNADPKGADDSVMALAIACTVAIIEGPFTYAPGQASRPQEGIDLMGETPWSAFDDQEVRA